MLRRLLAVLVLVLGASASLAGEARFLSVYDDLPLAAGLAELPGSGLSFDTPSGRIVEAYAKGATTTAAVQTFYADTLPQLGWTRAGDGVFRRDAEVLRIEAHAEGRAVAVHFTVSPE